MSEENVEVVRRGYELYGAGDLAGVSAVFAPDAELADTGGLGLADTAAGTRHGPEGFLRATEEVLEAFEDYRIETKDFIEAGDAVVVPVRIRPGENEGGEAGDAPCTPVGGPKRQGDPRRGLSDRRRSPRSRRTAGLGNVGGKRGGGQSAVRGFRR
jgi:ketosteroid isomerase-like protein